MELKCRLLVSTMLFILDVYLDKKTRGLNYLHERVSVFPGEAVYVDDIPSLPDCLHGAIIYSTKPLARIKNIGFEGNVSPNGVLAVITVKDIPQVGQNIGYISIFGTGLLFADEVTLCAGQIIALVVSSISSIQIILAYLCHFLQKY